jgi:hypothetical protein
MKADSGLRLHPRKAGGLVDDGAVPVVLKPVFTVGVPPDKTDEKIFYVQRYDFSSGTAIYSYQPFRLRAMFGASV